jgi:PAS domain S-box-containing protein
MEHNDIDKALRIKAEKKYAKDSYSSVNNLKLMSLEEIASVVHELQVHQIELEMQNEELLELFTAKMRYFELFNMAPIGYCTLNSNGLIIEANLASSDMLGVPRTNLKNLPLTNFIFNKDQDSYYFFQKKVLASDKQQSCELRMQNTEGKIFWVRLIAFTEQNNLGSSTQKLVFLDISERKTIEAIKAYNENLHNLSEHTLHAREDERKAIARDIHDDLGQLMTALKIDLSWIKQKIPQSAEFLMPKIDTVIRHIEAGIQSVRDVVAKLRPLILDDLGLKATIEWHSERYLTSSNINNKLIFKLDEKLLSEELSTLLFRIYQEALTNAIRYSGAKNILISLTQKEDSIILQIKDDGIGITKEQINNPKSFGLIGMRERLRPYAGTLEITGKTGFGTTLKASINNFKKEIYND